jgi:hypothetical protein
MPRQCEEDLIECRSPDRDVVHVHVRASEIARHVEQRERDVGDALTGGDAGAPAER